MGQLVVQEFVTADGFAANVQNEFTAYEMLEGGTAEFDRSSLTLSANTYDTGLIELEYALGEVYRPLGEHTVTLRGAWKDKSRIHSGSRSRSWIPGSAEAVSWTMMAASSSASLAPRQRWMPEPKTRP